MPTKKELQKRLDTVCELVEEPFRQQQPMLAHMMRLLINIREVVKGRELFKKNGSAKKVLDKEEELSAKEQSHIILSCDASIKKNPGGPSSIAFVIRKPGEKILVMAKHSPATSNNQAEYDAVYEALTTFFNLTNNPGCKVEVRSDSRLAINQLNGEMKCHDKDLRRRRDLILEFVRALPVPIDFVWMPRNSTADLKTANYKAQALLGVRKH